MAGKRVYEFNPTVLAERYHGEGLTERALAERYEVDQKVIHNRLVEYGIPRRRKWSRTFKRGRDGWARHYKQCIECHSDGRPHKGYGFCESCYRKWVRGGRP